MRDRQQQCGEAGSRRARLRVGEESIDTERDAHRRKGRCGVLRGQGHRECRQDSRSGVNRRRRVDQHRNGQGRLRVERQVDVVVVQPDRLQIAALVGLRAAGDVEAGVVVFAEIADQAIFEPRGASELDGELVARERGSSLIETCSCQLGSWLGGPFSANWRRARTSASGRPISAARL